MWRLTYSMYVLSLKQSVFVMRLGVNAMRIIGYVRVSSDEQARDGVSLAVQSEKVRQFASLHDLELVDVIIDAGVSAKTLDRPGLTRALGMLDAGQADGIVVMKLDRLTRSVRDLADLLDAYFGEAAGKQLFSVGDSIDTRTAAGRLVLNVLMSVSQWEREVIVERTRSAMSYKKAKDERVGNVPYGFTLADDGRSLIADSGENEILRAIADLHKQGLPLRAIAKHLEDRKLPTKTGRPWSHATVQTIVKRLAS